MALPKHETSPPEAANPNAVMAYGGREESFLQASWRRFRRHKLAIAGSSILLVLTVMALFAPWIAPENWDAINPPNKLKDPSWTHLMGTDHLGRDVWSRIVWGARVSLMVGITAAGIAVGIGTVIGAAAGYFGGKIDAVLSRLIEIVISIPTFFLLLTIVSVVSRSTVNIVIVIGVTSWPGVARLVRGQFLSLREREFAQASRAAGATAWRIMFRHLLPNALAPIIVTTTNRVGNAIIYEASLSYLGLGPPPPLPTWGAILNLGKDYLKTAPWIATWPGIFIFITVLAFSFVGDGLRDAMDPKQKR